MSVTIMEHKNNLTATELINIVSRYKEEQFPCHVCRSFIAFDDDKDMNGFGRCVQNNVAVQRTGTCSAFKAKQMSAFAWIAQRLKK